MAQRLKFAAIGCSFTNYQWPTWADFLHADNYGLSGIGNDRIWYILNQLYDKDPVGNSDVLQLLTWLGIWNHKTIGALSIPYRKEFLKWAWDSYEKVQSDIGYTTGELEHMYHGHQNNRNYHGRNQILVKNHYVPSEDLRLDTNNLYCIPHKPHLRKDLCSYFNNRTSSGS